MSIARPLGFATGAACVATLLAYAGRWSWFCDLLVNFRTHFFLLLCLALAIAIAVRRWRIAGAAVIGLALNAWPLHAAFVAPEAASASNGRTVRVASFNAHISNENMPAIAAYLASEDVDVAVLVELSPDHAEELAALLPRLPHRYLSERDGIWGVVILSRWPLIAPQSAMQGTQQFAARADLDLGDGMLRLYGLHLHWPLMKATARVRNAQLQALRQELAQCPHACVAVGDFNVAPWSSHFRDVLKSSGIRDCAAGRGLLNTWPASLPAVLRIRIDQCLVAGAISVAEVRVGESVGSDHFATLNDLVVIPQPQTR